MEQKIYRMWAARDKKAPTDVDPTQSNLCLYEGKPYLEKGEYYFPEGADEAYPIHEDLLPDLKFEDGPVRVDIILNPDDTTDNLLEGFVSADGEPIAVQDDDGRGTERMTARMEEWKHDWVVKTLWYVLMVFVFGAGMGLALALTL